MVNRKIFRINGVILSHLLDVADNYSVDSYKLVAVYSILKSSRQGAIKYTTFKSNNNKTVSGYNLLRNKTNLSLSVLHKYVTILIDNGLCYFDRGDFVLLGNRKSKTLFKKKTSKLIPIIIGKNLTETRYNVISVLLHSKEDKINYATKRKHNRREIIIARDPKNQKEFNFIKRYEKNPSKYDLDNYTDKCVLSNMGYAKLIKNKDNNKSLGTYYKSKLKKYKLINSKRQFKKVCKMSLKEYFMFKNTLEHKGYHTWMEGNLCIESTASFICNDLTKVFKTATKEVVTSKPKETFKVNNYNKRKYLDFDFIDWLISEDIYSCNKLV